MPLLIGELKMEGRLDRNMGWHEAREKAIMVAHIFEGKPPQSECIGSERAAESVIPAVDTPLRKYPKIWNPFNPH